MSFLRVEMRVLYWLCVIGTTALGMWSWSGWAQDVPPGFDAASFMRVGVGPHALAMGGAFVAIAKGPTAVYWNPAGLADSELFESEGMYTDLLGAGIHLHYIGVAGYPELQGVRPGLRFGDRPLTFGLNWLFVRVADIPWWEEDGTQGTFDALSHAFVLAVAWPLSESPFVSLGVSGKLYHDRILDGYSLGVGADVGLLWRVRIREVPVTLGVSATDLGGTKVQWYGTTGEPVNHVPWLLRAGAAISLWNERITLAASYEGGVNRPRFERVRVGGEVRLDWLSLRVGWDQPLTGEPGRWSGGMGLRLQPWLTLDYALVPGDLEDSHLIGMKLAF